MDNEKHKPELIIIAGPNGSGKTSITKRFLHHEWAEGTIYINPDEVANEIFADWNSNDAVLKAANYCAELRKKCLSERKSFVFENMIFVITGSVEHFANRNEVKDVIESKGGKVTGSVTSKTNYLINNDVTSTSSKNKKAKELGIPIITEVEFLKMLKA